MALTTWLARANRSGLIISPSVSMPASSVAVYLELNTGVNDFDDPATGLSIQIERSLDSGLTWAAVGGFTAVGLSGALRTARNWPPRGRWTFEAVPAAQYRARVEIQGTVRFGVNGEVT